MGLKDLKVGRRGAWEQGNREVAAKSLIRQHLLRVYKSRWFLFSWEGPRKVFSIVQWVLGSCGVIWTLFMVLLILHHSFQSICVPKCCSQKKKEFKSRGYLERWSGRTWTVCYVQLRDRQKWREAGIGEGKDGSKQGVWWDQLLRQDGGGTMPAPVP